MKRVQIIPSEYGFASVIQPELGSRPEPTQAQLDAQVNGDNLSRSQFKKEFGLTEADLVTLRDLGFPQQERATISGIGLGARQGQVFSRREYAAKKDAIKALAARLP